MTFTECDCCGVRIDFKDMRLTPRVRIQNTDLCPRCAYIRLRDMLKRPGETELDRPAADGTLVVRVEEVK